MKFCYLRAVFFSITFFCGRLYGQSHPDLGSFEDYAANSKVWLASSVGDVVVNPQFPLVASALGDIEWKVSHDEEVVEDQVIALLSMNKIILSERKFNLLKSRYANSRTDLESSNREEQKSLRASQRELVAKYASLEMTPTERQLLGGDFEKRLEAERATLKADIGIMESKLNSRYFEQALLDGIESLNLEIDTEEQTHQDLVRDSQIRAMTDGKLEIKLQEVVKPESEIGMIVKDKRGEVRLEISGPLLGNIPPDQLSVELEGEDGKRYEGIYERSLSEVIFERSSPMIIFSLQKQEDAEEIPENLSGRRMCRIYRNLDKPGRIVPKEKLIFEHPDEINEGGWAAFIEARWPGVELAYVGPRDLVVRRKNEN